MLQKTLKRQRYIRSIVKINIVYADLKTKIRELKGLEYTIIGTKVDGGKSLNTFSKLDKYVIIMGNEGNGISEDVLSLCDEYLYIPMDKSCESLNVGVAASIIAYSLNMR